MEPISWLQNCNFHLYFTLPSQKQSATEMDKTDGLEMLAYWTWALVIFQSLASNLDSVWISAAKLREGDWINVVYSLQ